MFKKKEIGLLLTLVFWVLLPTALLAQQSNWEAPEETNELVNPLEVSERVLNAGNQMYQQLCAVCHGKKGRGDGIAAAPLNPKPASLIDPVVQNQSEGALFWKIQEGRPPMPSFKNQLSEQQVWALVIYIKALDSNNSN